MGRVDGKVAIVTGAAAGIGRGIAHMLAREGAQLVLCDIDTAGGEALSAEIVASGGAAQFLPLDVSDETGWKDVIELMIAQHGRIDVLVNNAGVQLSKLLTETTLEDWRRVFRINVEGTFLGTRGVMTVMKERGEGSIVNISSTMAWVVNELNAAYCASKAAVTQLTKVAAIEGAADGARVRVNSVHPGVITTPMVEKEIVDVARERGVTPDTVRAEFERLCLLGTGVAADIAYGVVYLASDESRYVTGSELVIDGGHTISRR
jgi:3(or 17)beta-hydroxysteroid dehydrogenase